CTPPAPARRYPLSLHAALPISVLASLGILAVAVALLYGWYRSDLAAARQRIASGSELAQTACGTIEYAVVGEGPAVLLGHGAGRSGEHTAELQSPTQILCPLLL